MGTTFNSVLVNFYANGKNGVNFHADDEPEISPGSSIASLSIDANRIFDLQHINSNDMTSVCLTNGSLLVMGEGCQSFYKHRLRIEPHVTESRINLTLRKLSCNGG